MFGDEEPTFVPSAELKELKGREREVYFDVLPASYISFTIKFHPLTQIEHSKTHDYRLNEIGYNPHHTKRCLDIRAVFMIRVWYRYSMPDIHTNIYLGISVRLGGMGLAV